MVNQSIGTQPVSDKLDFSQNWSFAKGPLERPSQLAMPKGACPINLPHTWNAQDMTPGSLNPYIGDACYAKRFRAPSLDSTQRLLVEFEAVSLESEVYLNGAFIGGRVGGFLEHRLDLTDALHTSESNELLVRVTNEIAPARTLVPAHIDWERYGGIFRPVWLDRKGHAYFSHNGIAIRYPEVSEKEAQLQVGISVFESDARRHSSTPLRLRAVLLDPEGRSVSTAEAVISTRFRSTSKALLDFPPIVTPRLWSPDEPNLYSLEITLFDEDVELDREVEQVGFRFFRFDPNEGFVLNGESTKLRGANLHHDYPGLGSARPERLEDLDIQLLKDTGCNFIRGSHYPRSRRFLDLCDTKGMLVLEEQTLWHGSIRASLGETFVQNAKRLLQDLIRQNGNHPSVIAWNLANEVLLAPVYDRGQEHLAPNDPKRKSMRIRDDEIPFVQRCLGELFDVVKAEDPFRPVSNVIGGFWDWNDQARLTQIADLVGYNGGAIGYRDPNFQPSSSDDRYTFRPDYYREKFPSRLAFMSEGIVLDKPARRADWKAEMNAWKRNARYWNDIYARKWFPGGSMWCFTDYSANGNYRVRGIFDYWRSPTELYYFYRAMWHASPTLHILGHWNRNDVNESLASEIVVFSNCEDVQLWLNGRNLGAGETTGAEFPNIPHPPRIWRGISFEPGTLEARAQKSGAPIAHRLVTSGEPAQILLEANPREIRADGRDAVLIDCVVADSEGTRCFNYFSNMSVTTIGSTLEDPCAFLPEIRGGLARFALRSTGLKGDTDISVATADLPASRILVSAN